MRTVLKKGKCREFLRKHPLFISIGYFFIYLPIFQLLELYREPRFFVHCRLDDLLPFSEYFLIPYLLWFLFVPGMLIFFLKYSKNDYLKCCKVIFGGMSLCLLLYWLFPTGLMLREPVKNTNIFAAGVNLLRSMDTPTNVCPSIHVSSTVGIMLVFAHSRELSRFRGFRLAVCAAGVLICLSTVLLDQHSVIDVICGAVLSTVLCSVTEMMEEDEEYRVRHELLR